MLTGEDQLFHVFFIGLIHKYCGPLITEDGRCEEEIKRRIAIARTTFTKTKRALTSNSLSLKTMERILSCYVWSTRWYGAKIWTLHVNKPLRKRLAAFAMWAWRLLKLSWT